MERRSGDSYDDDSWEQSSDQTPTDERAKPDKPVNPLSDSSGQDGSEAEPTFAAIDPGHHFCYRLSCRAWLATRNQESPELRLRPGDSADLKQPPIEQRELSCGFPKRCKLYLNVFRHSRTQPPSGATPSDWDEIPFVFSQFQHHGGDLLIRISGSVCVNSIVVETVVRPREEFWAILNQSC